MLVVGLINQTGANPNAFIHHDACLAGPYMNSNLKKSLHHPT